MNDFYVYVYCDGRYLFNNSKFKKLVFKPFYVGKGKGSRCKDTIKKVLRNGKPEGFSYNRKDVITNCSNKGVNYV